VSSVVAQPILIAVMMAVLILGTASLQQSEAVLDLATRQSTSGAAARLHTIVQPVGSTVLSSGSELSLTFRNSGDVAISDFAHADVFVQYAGVAGYNNLGQPYSQRVLERLTYAPTVAHTLEWDVAQISPDILNPGIWDPGEVITLALVLPEAAMPGVPGIAALVTPNGVTSSAYFTR
jgi:flagellar protein FlaF